MSRARMPVASGCISHRTPSAPQPMAAWQRTFNLSCNNPAPLKSARTGRKVFFFKEKMISGFREETADPSPPKPIANRISGKSRRKIRSAAVRTSSTGRPGGTCSNSGLPVFAASRKKISSDQTVRRSRKASPTGERSRQQETSGISAIRVKESRLQRFQASRPSSGT